MAYGKGNISSSMHYSNRQPWWTFSSSMGMFYTSKNQKAAYSSSNNGQTLLPRDITEEFTAFAFSGGFPFMHDNDPKHTSPAVNNCLVKQHKKILLYLSYCPDLNPIEHLWNKLGRRLKKHQSKNRQELGNLLMEEWNKSESSVLEKAADSVATRLYECTRVKSSPTKIICCSLHRITNIFCQVGE